MKSISCWCAALGALFISLTVNAAEPQGYYSSCEHLGGKNLLVALYNVIGEHENVGYGGLWTVYLTSDVRDDGTIWDMYSTKHWKPQSEQCGNYKEVGDCYNREHSMPKSWFNDASPMVSDAFHIYPTDGKVNGQRSNYPYGECSGGTNLGTHSGVKALGRLGRCTFPGYTGTVFEPDDEYKGDFARSYFYMAACYNNRVSSWDSDMLAGNSYPAFTTWAVNLLLTWHEEDPVSDKERKRNDVIYGYQNNRNPFIDHPELADYIWGSKKSERWTLPSGIEEAEIATVTVTPTATGVQIGVGPEWTAVQIVSVDGVTWFDGEVAETEFFSLERGIYLVRVGAQIFRILVK